jgi:aerobic carbon-monoxide dehydrogenase medium subunit
MKPAAFAYERPATVAAVLDLLAQGDDGTKIIAGGQSLVPMMNFRLARPERLIDINRLPGLDYIRRDGDVIAIGALARHTDVKDSPLVAQACPLMHMAYEWVAHGAVRNRGTLCGNLCHADPASEMPAIMLAVGATMVLRSKRAERHVSAADFFQGMYTTAARADEMLVEVRLPVAPAGQKAGFGEVSMRKGDFAWATAAVLLTVAGGKITQVAIAAAGIADRACRLSTVEAAIAGQAATQATFARAGELAAAAVTPFGDAAISAEYRKDLLRTLVERALADAAA